MILHSRTITKPKSADASDVEEVLDKMAFVRNVLTQIDAYLAVAPKTQASS